MNKDHSSRTMIAHSGSFGIFGHELARSSRRAFSLQRPSGMAVSPSEIGREEKIVTLKPVATSNSSPYSARPLTEKGNNTVIRILEEAKNIIVEDGFPGLSFRAIAKRAGTTVGNIGYYYGTKDDLMVDLAEYIFDKWEMRVQRDMPAALSDKLATFRYFIRSMIDQNKRRRTMFLLLEMWAMANRSQAVAKMMDTFYGRLRNSIEGMIADLNPGMTAETRALRAALITTQIEGLMILVGPGKPRHSELSGIEAEAMLQIEKMALAP
jgi:AcrR family transcriptional regulator